MSRQEQTKYDCDNSGNDYVLYSMLKVSNMSLDIILHEVYSHRERTIDFLPQILKISFGGNALQVKRVT